METTETLNDTSKARGSLMIRNLIKANTLSLSLVTLAFTLSGMIDLIIVGQFLGDDAIAAIGLSMPVTKLWFGVVCMLTDGFLLLCAHALGRGNKKDADGLFSLSILIGISIGLLVGVPVFLFATQIGTFCGADGTLLSDTADYLKGLAIGFAPNILNSMLLAYANLGGEKKLNIISAIVLATVNISGDLLSIGLGGGMLGIGLATSASYVAAICMLCPRLFGKKASLHFKTSGLRWKKTFEAIYLGAPSAAKQAMISVLSYALNLILLAVGGSVAVAASSIFASWAGVAYIAGVGVSSVGNLLAGIFYGEGNRRLTALTLKGCLKYGFVFCCIPALITIVAAPLIVDIFMAGQDLATKDFVATAIRILAVGSIAEHVNLIYERYLAGIRNVPMSSALAVVPVAYQLLFALVLGQAFGINGVWAALFLAHSLAFLTFIIIAKLMGRTYTFLPNDFGVAENSLMEKSITTIDEIQHVVHCAKEFCLKRGSDDKSANTIALCIEEMASNALLYGGTSEQNPQVDVLVIQNDHDTVLRVRDNCLPFNPEKYFDNMVDADDPTKNLGIKIVFKLADEIDYVPLMGINNIIITVRYGKLANAS